MTLRDRYDLPLSTVEPVARDAYVEAIDLFLGAEPGIETALDRALAADPNFALAHMARARIHQVHGQGALARRSAGRAVELVGGATARERGHVAALERVIAGDRAGALSQIRAHLDLYPRDVPVLLPCAGVFGLFGFSGEAGREQRTLEFLAPFAAVLGDDWWFLAALAFAQSETGNIETARANVERSLDLNPRNANAAHIRAHVHYEAGEAAAGLAWLTDWFKGYDRAGYMHCHLGWHVAIWNLDLGRAPAAWQAYEALVQPAAADGRGAWGPPLNVLTDAAAFLFRAELAGARRDRQRWAQMAAYARSTFPKPGLAFADAHSALAYAMAGDDDALAALISGACGPAGDMVAALGRGFGAFARGDWPAAVEALAPVCREHERIGGSRAQRDLIELALATAAERAGRPEAHVMRRRGGS